MRLQKLAIVSALLGGCAPAAADYSSLVDAARARERPRAAAAVEPSGGVKRLLARPLDADAAAEVALRNNRGARAFAEELGIARAELSGARRLPNPSLHGALRFQDSGRPEIDLGAMLSLTGLLASFYRAGAAETNVEAAELRAVGTFIDLAFDTRRALFEYQAALQTLELRRHAVAAFDAAAEAALRLREAGNVSELALANEQSALAEARLRLGREELAARRARERLNTLMGLAEDTGWRAAATLPEPPAASLGARELERDALKRSLDLEIEKRGFAAAQQRESSERALGFIPELKAGVSAERQDEWGVGPAIELELPLLYQGQGEVGVARAERRQHEHAYAELTVQVRAEARAVGAELEATRERVGYARDVLLPLRRKVVEQTQLHYNGMLIGVFELLQAKREEIEAEALYIAELRDHWLVRMRAEQLLAGRLASAMSASPAATEEHR